MFILPGNPNANIGYFLDHKAKYPIALHVKMNGLAFVVFDCGDHMLMYTFNVCGIADNVIILNGKKSIVTSWKIYNRMTYKKEGLLDNNSINVTYKHKQNSKPSTIGNIFAYNYSNLSLFDNITLEQFGPHDTLFHNHTDWFTKDKLNKIPMEYGIPFEIITDCFGYSLWIYIGYHKCNSGGVKLGFIILNIDNKNRIVSSYKYCYNCDKCSGKSGLLKDFQSFIYN